MNTAVAGRGSRAAGFASMSEPGSGSNRTSTGTSARIPPAAARAITASPVMRQPTHVSPRGLPVAAAVGRELFLRGEKYLYCVAGRD